MIDYDYYKNTYNGSLSKEDFPRYELEAVSFLMYYTTNRIEGSLNGQHRGQVMLTTCKVIDLYYERDKALKDIEQGLSTSRKGIASESVTDHTVSFKQVSEDAITKLDESFNKRIISTARQGLLWTGLLYRGI